MPTSSIPPARALARPALLGATLLVGAACATGSTFRSGVGDAHLESPPYYAGARVAREVAPRIVHLPIGYQRGATQAPNFDPASGSGTPTVALLAEMNRFLDSLGVTTPVDAAAGISRGMPPDVHFGCPATPSDEECSERRDPDPDERRMILAVGRPSASWVEWAAGALDRAQASAVLVSTLETGQYWTRQKGRFGGRKAVELGTGYSQPVPWLTSLDAPAHVLQITGALMGRDGRAMRIGAEGLFAKRTNIVLSGLGAQALLSDEDVERVRTLRRDDLPGRPLVWQVAIRNLVAELTGRTEVTAR
ncbi:MAG: hypothetical protein ABR499_04315 [Gemmatimonadaceae bacterium]